MLTKCHDLEVIGLIPLQNARFDSILTGRKCHILRIENDI
jgi:hypothetical protein